ncbi:solute carrier family 35 member G1-like [Diadema antillarum]|uniref:solute carrier family 35 member G1-like n=1 Tax=Diadema antillarum TaxID=105358 RepID=UPI003A8402CC
MSELEKKTAAGGGAEPDDFRTPLSGHVGVEQHRRTGKQGEFSSVGERTQLFTFSVDHEKPITSSQKITSHHWVRGNILYQYRGIFLAFAAVFFYLILQLMTKQLTGRVSSNALNAYFSVMLAASSAPVLIWNKLSLSNIPRKAWAFLMIRGLSGAFGFLCYFKAFQLLELSTANSLILTSPLFTIAFERVCVKESCSVVKVICAFGTVAGIIFVMQPPAVFGAAGDQGTSDTWLGAVMALSVAALIAIAFVSQKPISNMKVHAQLIVFIFACIASIVSFATTTALADWSVPRCGRDRVLVVLIGILGCLGVHATTLALEVESAGSFNIIRASSVFFAFILDVVILREAPNGFAIFGACLIVGSAVGNVTASCLKLRSDGKKS